MRYSVYNFGTSQQRAAIICLLFLCLLGKLASNKSTWHFSNFAFYVAGYHLLQPLLKYEINSKTKNEEKLLKNQREVLSEITSLKKKINELEISLEQAEFRVPKTFPNIKFLNYKDRKRILVKLFTHLVRYFFLTQH